MPALQVSNFLYSIQPLLMEPGLPKSQKLIIHNCELVQPRAISKAIRMKRLPNLMQLEYLAGTWFPFFSSSPAYC
jgi:hypothetical protein